MGVCGSVCTCVRVFGGCTCEWGWGAHVCVYTSVGGACADMCTCVGGWVHVCVCVVCVRVRACVGVCIRASVCVRVHVNEKQSNVNNKRKERVREKKEDRK